MEASILITTDSLVSICRPCRRAPFLALFAAALLSFAAGCTSSSSTPPSVSKLSTTSGSVGTVVTITGTNFQASQLAANGTVTFGSVQASPISWNNTTIIVNVPSGVSGTVNVVVSNQNTSSAPVSFTVTSGAISDCGTGSESLLFGPYAYLMQGFQGATPGNPLARVGSFTADGAGHIKIGSTTMGGEEDLNIGTNGNSHRTIVASASSYSVGADYRGCLTLGYSDSTTTTYRFALAGIASGVAARGRIVEFDDASGAGSVDSGILLQQATGDFGGSVFAANYAFGLSGTDTLGGHVAMGGTFGLSGNTISQGYFDLNDPAGVGVPFGLSGSNGHSTGTLLTAASTTQVSSTTGISSATGRTTGAFDAGSAGVNTYNFNWAVYVVNRNQFFVIGTDTLGTATPISSGRVLSTGTGFSSNAITTAAAPNGFTYEATGQIGGDAAAQVGNVSFTASAYSSYYWVYGLGSGVTVTPASSPASAGSTFSVYPSGRTVINAGGLPSAVIYLTNGNSADDDISGFYIDVTSSSYYGLLVINQNPTFTAGRYDFGTANPGDDSVLNLTGVAAVLVHGAPSNASTVQGVEDASGQTAGLSSSTFGGVNFTALSGAPGSLGMVTASASGSTYVGVGTGGSALFFIQEGTGLPASVRVAQQ